MLIICRSSEIVFGIIIIRVHRERRLRRLKRFARGWSALKTGLQVFFSLIDDSRPCQSTCQLAAAIALAHSAECSQNTIFIHEISPQILISLCSSYRVSTSIIIWIRSAKELSPRQNRRKCYILHSTLSIPSYYVTPSPNSSPLKTAFFKQCCLR